jgi:hypothetical protein
MNLRIPDIPPIFCPLGAQVLPHKARNELMRFFLIGFLSLSLSRIVHAEDPTDKLDLLIKARGLQAQEKLNAYHEAKVQGSPLRQCQMNLETAFAMFVHPKAQALSRKDKVVGGVKFRYYYFSITESEQGGVIVRYGYPTDGKSEASLVVEHLRNGWTLSFVSASSRDLIAISPSCAYLIPANNPLGAEARI